MSYSYACYSDSLSFINLISVSHLESTDSHTHRSTFHTIAEHIVVSAPPAWKIDQSSNYLTKIMHSVQ